MRLEDKSDYELHKIVEENGPQAKDARRILRERSVAAKAVHPDPWSMWEPA